MEAVVERLDIKQQLLAKVDEKRRPDRSSARTPRAFRSPRWPKAARRISASTGSARTSSIRRATCACSRSFRPPKPIRRSSPRWSSSAITCSARAWSSPRTRRTSSPITSACTAWRARSRCWRAASTPIEEIDAITGPALGRPGSATFRTMDIAGIDVLAHVMRNLSERLPSEADRAAFATPPIVEALIARGALGEKTGKGFYERRKSAAGETEIWTLDPGVARLPPEAIGAHCRRSKPASRSTTSASACGCCSMRRTRPANSCARRSRRRWSTPRASRRRSRIRSTMSIARCGGALAGTSVRSSCSMRSASRTCSPPPKARMRWPAACRR